MNREYELVGVVESTDYLDIEVLNGVNYCYYVVASNISGDSGNSNIDCAEPFGLNAATNLYEQIALLTKMVELRSIDAKIHIYNQQRSVRELIEEVYTQAGRLRLWSVLRQATGLQGKIDGDIGLAVGDLLVAQKLLPLSLMLSL